MDRSVLTKSRSGHGGNIYSDQTQIWLDFSANINPKQLPQAIYQALPTILDQAKAYPDIEYEALRDHLARYSSSLSETAIAPEWIIPGNGAIEILDKALATASKALIIRPCFGEYELSCIRHGVPYETLDRAIDQNVLLEDAFFDRLRARLKMEIPVGSEIPGGSELASVSSQGRIRVPEFDTIVLCNPNNPDGKQYDKAAFRCFLTECAQVGIRLIVDETFGEYLNDGEMLLSLVSDYPNLLVVKALTKFFGLPGVRLGYGITRDPTWREAIIAQLTTWNVGVFAQEIAKLLLKDKAFIQDSRLLNYTNRAYLTAGLKASLLFETVYPSAASFVMVSSPNMIPLIKDLKEQGILIRNLSNMPVLGTGFSRIAVKDRSSIDKLLTALQTLETKHSTPE